MPGYEAGDVESGEVKKGDTPFCAALLMNSTEGKSIDVTIKLNATATIIDIGILERIYSWTEQAKMRRFRNWLESLPSDFISIQNYVEKFILEQAGYVSNSTDPFFVPFPTDQTSRLGIPIVQPNIIANLAGWNHMSGFIIAVNFASTVFRERIQHIREGLQMMGLTDRAYYLSVLSFYLMWIVVPTILCTYILYAPPGEMFSIGGYRFLFLDRVDEEGVDSGIGTYETLFPGSNFIYIWWMMWGNMFAVLLQTLWFGCFTNRRPVFIMVSYVFVEFGKIIPNQGITESTPPWLRFLICLIIPFGS
jgi:hypothetical protein